MATSHTHLLPNLHPFLPTPGDSLDFKQLNEQNINSKEGIPNTNTAYYLLNLLANEEDLDEKVLPDVRLTRSRDGSTGTATFRFKNPNILDKNTAKEGEITGMYLIDEEGILETRDVNARFINGKPETIESIYIMKSPEAWDRFMRFMERYGDSNGLVFTKAN